MRQIEIRSSRRNKNVECKRNFRQTVDVPPRVDQLAKLDAVQALVVCCWSRARIISALSVEWQCSRKIVESMLGKVYERMQRDAERRAVHDPVNRIRGVFEDLYDKS